MSFPGVLGPAAHRLSDPGAGETFLFRTSARGAAGRFSFEWQLAPGRVGPGQHTHPNETETFRIISGELVVVIDGKRHHLHPGATLTVPAGAPHYFEHPGSEPLIAEVTLSSTFMEDQFIPICAHFGDPERLTLSALPQVLVHIQHWMQVGSNVPTSAVVRMMLALLVLPFRLLGVRPLPPVTGWDDAAAAVAQSSS